MESGVLFIAYVKKEQKFTNLSHQGRGCGRFLVPVPRANAGSGTGNNMEEQLTHLIMTDMAIRQQ